MSIITINSLPPEILSDIFLHLPHEDRTFIVEGTPWSLGWVCSKWREVVLNTPKLWSTLSLDSDVLHLDIDLVNPDAPYHLYSDILGTALKRAGPDTLLRVVMAIFLPEPEEDPDYDIIRDILQSLADLLLDECERWQSALIGIAGEDIRIVPPEGKTFRALENIYITWIPDSPLTPDQVDITDTEMVRDPRVGLIRALARSAPRLRSLGVDALERRSEPLAYILPTEKLIAPIAHLSAANWILVDLRIALQHLSPHLETLTIEHLSLADPYEDSDSELEDDENEWAIAHPPPPPETHIALNLLRRLQFDVVSEVELGLFENLDTPSLEELYFHDSQSHDYHRIGLYDVAAVVGRRNSRNGTFRSVRSLSIAGFYVLDGAGIVRLLQVLPTVTHLNLKGPITSWLIRKFFASEPPLIPGLSHLSLDHTEIFISLNTPFSDIKTLLLYKSLGQGEQHNRPKSLRSLDIDVLATPSNVEGVRDLLQRQQSTVAQPSTTVTAHADEFSDYSHRGCKDAEEKAIYTLEEFFRDMMRRPVESSESFLALVRSSS
ncbi:hypothetical protein V5O48_017095 [Marasmius crinis-equi]|uniref:F-box domain-containing protein n=1 Tax=Marasmius crinis-equi TaxID=585013 RepID=A0ABR3EQ47_9AGAR